MRAFVALVVLAAALSGCADPDDPEPGDPTTTGAPTTTATPTPTPTPDAPGSITQFSADRTSGDAPLIVTFTLDGSSEDDDATWRIGFGDGTDDAGDVADLPQDVTHTYRIGGEFTAQATIADASGTVRSQNITVSIVAPPPGETPPLVFEFGPSAGCVTEGACAGEAAGPTAPPVDGHWQALDERYWGMVFSSTVTRGGETGQSGDDWPLFDSDCFFYGEDTATRIGDAHNGGGACGSADGVPEGALWIFIAPYALPAEAMTLTFGVPPE